MLDENPFAGEQWDAWIEMRRKMRKSPTDYAMKLAIKTLAKLRDQGHDPGDVLDQSTLHGWTGLFPIRQEFNDGSSRQPNLRGPRPDPALDLYRAARAAEEAERERGDSQDYGRDWLALPPGRPS